MGRRRWAFDGAIALVVLVLGQVEAWHGEGATHRQGPHWAQALAYGIAALCLLGRRWRPLETLTAVVVVYAVEFALVGSPEGNAVGLPLIIAGYSVARWERRHPSWWGLPILGAFVIAWIGFDPLETAWSMRAAALFWALQPMVAWLIGALVRSRLQEREHRRLRAEAAQVLAVARVQVVTHVSPNGKTFTFDKGNCLPPSDD